VEANIGKVQEQNLYDAILTAYERFIHDDFPYPDFHSVRDELEGITPKPDSLTSVFRPLTEHNLFATRDMPVWDSLVNRTVVFDIHELPALKDLCVFFVLNELYRQLMLLPDSRVDENSRAREMRTVIVIDEAHHFLKSKKRVKILEDLIREIRSKGASVILLSQSPDDYDHADFNFLELLEFVFVLGCNPSSYKFLQQVFGVSAEYAKKLMRDVTALNRGEAFGKVKDKKVVPVILCK
jgi:DNA sulfur modification protein DndE